MIDPDGKLTALGHCDVLMKFVRTELRRKKLTDVIIVLGREEIAMHRLMLAAFSQYFAGIFTARPPADRNDKVDITSLNISSDIFHLLLDFMYSGELNTQDCVVIQVEEAAKKLKMKTLLALLKPIVTNTRENLKQSETELTPSKRGKQDLKGKQTTRKTDGNTDDVNTKAETEVIPDSKEPEAIPMKTHKGRKLKITESTVEQLSGKEDESGADTKEEEPEQPVKSIVQVPGKIVVRPGVRRTSRSAADRRIDEDNEEENNDEQVEKTSKGQDMEEVVEVPFELGTSLMSDDEKEGQEENSLFELENMNDFASPDTTFVDFNTTYEPEQKMTRRGRKSHAKTDEMFEYQEEKVVSLEDVELPSDPKDLSWVDTLIQATEKTQPRKRGRPRATRLKTTLPPDQIPTISPLVRSMGRTLKSLYLKGDGHYHCPFCPRTTDSYDNFRSHFGIHRKQFGIPTVSLAKDCFNESDNLYHCPCCDFVNANYNNFKGHYWKLHSNIPLALALGRKNPITGEPARLTYQPQIANAATEETGTSSLAEEIIRSISKGETFLEERPDVSIKEEATNEEEEAESPRSSPKKGSKMETPATTRTTRYGKRRLEVTEDPRDNKKGGRKKQRKEENLEDYSFDQECEKSATEFMKRLRSGKTIQALCPSLQDDDGYYCCPFCRYRTTYYFTMNKHIKSHRINREIEEIEENSEPVVEETAVTVDSVSLKPEEGEYVFTVRPVAADFDNSKDKTTQALEEGCGMGDVEKEGETEAGIAMQTNKGNGDEQIDEGKVEEQEDHIGEGIVQETGGTEPNLEGEIEGEETVIQVKMEDDSLSVSSVADLEARIRLLYFKEDDHFHCPFCQHREENIDLFLEHLKVERRKKKTYQPLTCQICGRVSYRKDHFIIHLRTHTDEKPFKCTWEDCDRSFKRRESLTDHIKRHKNLPIKKKPQYKPRTSYQCQECGKTVIRKDQFIAHLRTHSNDRPFKCPQCPSAFKHKTSLRCHVNTHLKKHLYKCDYEEGCKYETYDFWRYKSHVKHHKVKNLPKERVACEICGAVVGKLSLNSHKKMHSNEVFSCPVEGCDFKINTKKRLKNHLALKHELELDGKTKCTMYQCTVCDVYSTPNKYLFEAHMKLHTGVKPFKCPYCDFATATPYTVKIHIKRRHSDAKPHICKICGLSFKMKSELSKHLRSHEADPFAKRIMRPIRAFAQGQQIVIPEGAASFAFEDRDYSATEKEEIVSALYSLSGTVPETGTGNVIATRDENNQQVLYVYLPVDEEEGGSAGSKAEGEADVDTEQLIAQVPQDEKEQQQTEYIQMGENGELIEAQVTDVDAIQLDQQVQQQLQMGKQHIQIDGQQYQIEEQSVPMQIEGQQIQLEDGSHIQLQDGQLQVAAGEGGTIIQQFIDEQGNIIERQIISTEDAIFQGGETTATEVDGQTAIIEGQQIFEGQVEGQEAEVIHVKQEDLQPGDSLLKPR